MNSIFQTAFIHADKLFSVEIVESSTLGVIGQITNEISAFPMGFKFVSMTLIENMSV